MLTHYFEAGNANAIKSFHFFNPESEQRALPAVPVAMLHFNCKRA